MILPGIVLLAEAATLAVFAAYAIVLGSMHREAAHMEPPDPKRDPLGAELQRAARIAFQFGTFVVVVFSLFGWLT